MNFNKIIVFDLEMCCWDKTERSSTGDIIEIGLAEYCLTTKTIVRRSQYYIINQHDPISNFCTDLTGITQSLINKRGMPLSKAIQSIRDRFGGSGKLYSAWGRDDIVLNDQCNKENIPPLFSEFINLSTLYRMKGLGTVNRTDNRRYNLSDALCNHNIVFEGNEHSAYDDAFNTAKLLEYLI